MVMKFDRNITSKIHACFNTIVYNHYIKGSKCFLCTKVIKWHVRITQKWHKDIKEANKNWEITGCKWSCQLCKRIKETNVHLQYLFHSMPEEFAAGNSGCLASQ